MSQACCVDYSYFFSSVWGLNRKSSTPHQPKVIAGCQQAEDTVVERRFAFISVRIHHSWIAGSTQTQQHRNHAKGIITPRVAGKKSASVSDPCRYVAKEENEGLRSLQIMYSVRVG